MITNQLAYSPRKVGHLNNGHGLGKCEESCNHEFAFLTGPRADQRSATVACRTLI